MPEAITRADSARPAVLCQRISPPPSLWRHCLVSTLRFEARAPTPVFIPLAGTTQSGETHRQRQRCGP